jgi:hypothetical protein
MCLRRQVTRTDGEILDRKLKYFPDTARIKWLVQKFLLANGPKLRRDAAEFKKPPQPASSKG